MSALTKSLLEHALSPLPVNADGIPIFYEDEEEGDMGESDIHVVSGVILHTGVAAHLAGQSTFRVFFNMNCYYLDGPRHSVTRSLPYISPDVMVVKPGRDLGQWVVSYTIGRDGPAPLLVVEILSQRSAQQRDLKDKIDIYAKLEIREYMLVDVTGNFLPDKLLLKRLSRDGGYQDLKQESDGGITSRLGFRVVVEADGQVRVIDAKSGRCYPRPSEAAELEKRLRELEDELARLKGKPPLKRNRKKRT